MRAKSQEHQWSGGKTQSTDVNLYSYELPEFYSFWNLSDNAFPLHELQNILRSL